MARQLLRASQQSLESTGAPVTAAPFTFNLWMYHEGWAGGGFDTIAGLYDSTGSNYWIFWSGDAQRETRWAAQNGGYAETAGTIPSTQNAWSMLTGVVAANGDLTIYTNAANTNTTATGITPANIDRVRFGLSSGDWYQGGLANATIWNVALNQAEVQSVYNGGVAFIPNPIRPEAQVSHWRFWNNDGDIDYVGRFDLTPTNSPTWREHPPIVLWVPGRQTAEPGAVATPQITGTSTATVDTAGDADVLHPVTGSATATVDTTGDTDVLHPVTGSATATVDTAGDADVLHQVTGSATATVDTTGDAETLEQIVGTSTATINTAGEIALLLTGDSTATVDTAGDIPITISGSATATVQTQGTITIGLVVDGGVSAMGCGTADNYEILRDGWIDWPPQTDGLDIHVSSLNGDDGNGGTGPGDALATLAAGFSLLRDGFPDRLLLERGSEWSEGLELSNLNGRNRWERMHIASYGSGPRPRLLGGNGLFWAIDNVGWSSRNFWAVRDIDIYNTTRDWNHADWTGNPDQGYGGVVSLRAHNFWTCENVRTRFVRIGFELNWEPTYSAGFPSTNIRFHRCVSDHNNSWRINNQDAHGMYLDGTVDSVFYQTMFYHNGWAQVRDSAPDDTSTGGAFARHHNYYLQNVGNDSLKLQECWASEGSSRTIHFRAGGVMQDCLVDRNSTVSVGFDDFGSRDGGIYYVITDCVVMRCVYLNPTIGDYSSVGFDLENTRDGLYRRNLVIHSLEDQQGTTGAFRMLGNPPGVFKEPNFNVRYDSNISYDFVSGGPTDWNGDGWDEVTLEENNGWVPPIPIAGTNYDSTVVPWLDPNRTPDTYNATVGGPGTFADFVDNMLSQDKDSWNPDYEIPTINAYIRSGFVVGVPQIRGTSTGTVDTAGEARLIEGITGTSTATVDTTGNANVVSPITGSSTAVVATAGILDPAPIPQITGSATATVDTTGDPDVEGPEQIVGSATATVDTTGAADVLAQISGASTATVDTTGDADIRQQIEGSSLATVNTAGEPDVESPEQIVGSATATVDTTGTPDVIAKITGSSLATVNTAGDPDVEEPEKILGTSVAVCVTAGGLTQDDIIEQITGSATATVETKADIPVGVFDPVNSRVCALVNDRPTCVLPREDRSMTLTGG